MAKAKSESDCKLEKAFLRAIIARLVVEALTPGETIIVGGKSYSRQAILERLEK